MFPKQLLCSLLFRELGLQAADEDECGPSPHKKKKKKADEEDERAAAGGRMDAEHWVMKRQQQKARKAEEAMKNKRTVFVGNLPASCTKKVRLGCPSIKPSSHV